MNLSLEALLKGDVRLPKYRALYVDKLLEAHEELAASRDREFKSLIRSFQTIRDSDFEAPENLEEKLRPYQLYGFRCPRLDQVLRALLPRDDREPVFLQVSSADVRRCCQELLG